MPRVERSVALRNFLENEAIGNQPAERKRSLGKDYHPLCLKCYHCKRQLSPGQHAEYDDKPYCSHCYLQRFGPRGTRPLTSRSSFGASASSKVPATTRKTS